MKPVEHYLSLNYRTDVYRDDEGDFVVKVPELPGCVADGKTPNEAFENLGNAMRAWVESRLAGGLDVPEPKASTAYSGRLVIRMPRYLHGRLAGQAENEGVSLNHYMVSLLSEASGVTEARQAATVASANLAPWATPFSWWPHAGFVRAANCYAISGYDSLIAESTQAILINQSGFGRLSVSQEGTKETVLKPQLVRPLKA